MLPPSLHTLIFSQKNKNKNSQDQCKTFHKTLNLQSSCLRDLSGHKVIPMEILSLYYILAATPLEPSRGQRDWDEVVTPPLL